MDPTNHSLRPWLNCNFVHRGKDVGLIRDMWCVSLNTHKHYELFMEVTMNAAEMLATLAQMTQSQSSPIQSNDEDMNRGRYVLGDRVELTGTSYFPERINEKGETVPAVYSGWHDNFLFRVLGENADAINAIAPAWRQGEAIDQAKGGQVVVLGTHRGTSCRWKNPTPEYLGSYALTATHLTGEISIEAPKTIKFKLAKPDSKK